MWAGAPREARGELIARVEPCRPRAAHAAGAIALLQDFDLLKT